MSWIPGWDSIAGAGFWSGFYFWASIGALIGLGIFEVASHRYGDRKEELAAVEQDAKDKLHDKELALLRLETAQMQERSAELEKQAAQMQERSAELEKQAAAAKLELARLTTPRSSLITPPEVRAAMVEKLKPFAQTKYDIGHPHENAREVWDFLWLFEQVLIDANWDHVDWRGGPVYQKAGDWPGSPRKYWYGEANVSNVSIEVRPSYKDELMPAAKVLADPLNAVGIVAITWDNNNLSQNDDAIHILVGRRE